MFAFRNSSGSSLRRWLVVVAIVALVAAAWATSGRWWPGIRTGAVAREESQQHAGSNSAQHGHDHSGHSDDSSIELSENALKNIGFQPLTVKRSTFERTATMPAMVVEQPGRTQIHISAPLTGVVTRIYVLRGEAVAPGRRLFDVRLTHEELVTAQQEYLQTAENLDVVNREIARLRSLGEGVVAGKRILEQEYEKQKLEAALRAGEQALLLHGLSEEHVQNILKTRTLLQSLTIRAPADARGGEHDLAEHLFHVQSLAVSPGQQVEAGQELGVLADHCELFVEGLAFEDDAKRLRQAVRKGWNASARLLVGQDESEKIEGLNLLYLADHIDPESRAFRFYLRLPNEIVLDQQSPQNRRFIEWRFKPGQRMELNVPVEQWPDRIVLPASAVVDEGAESYVYRQNGDHFDRVAVHVEYRDRNKVVIANNGALFPGEVVAGEGAYQMHLALKNKAGGGVDPHAGHHH